MVKSDTIYWLEDIDDPSIEFEETLTFSKETVRKTLNKFKLDPYFLSKRKSFIIRSQKLNWLEKEKYKKIIYGIK